MNLESNFKLTADCICETKILNYYTGQSVSTLLLGVGAVFTLSGADYLLTLSGMGSGAAGQRDVNIEEVVRI